jgi:ABC-type molybdate transport system substrate-binding protein
MVLPHQSRFAGQLLPREKRWRFAVTRPTIPLMRTILALTLAIVAAPALAAEFRIMTTGAPRKAVDFVMERFGKEAGHTASFVQDTAGGVRRRVEGGETTDVIVATPDVLTALEKAGKASASRKGCRSPPSPRWTTSAG